MTVEPLIGLGMIAAAGVATACFYVPFKRVSGWTWETYWLVFGFTSWVIFPWLAAWLTIPNLYDTISQAPPKAVALCFLFGACWGIGSLTNGLALRYLGLSLGWAIPLGLCAALGTLLPPALSGAFDQLIETRSGNTTLVSVLVGLVGIALCARAGALKDRELSADQKAQSIVEFNLTRGLWLSLISGVMSACMAFGIVEGRPIAQSAIDHGADDLWQNTPLFAILLLGGFVSNATWCLLLGFRNRTTQELVTGNSRRLTLNYLLCLLAGGLWYLQSLFYGMGETKMGEYRFASWAVLMFCIIIFSNLWGILFKEWSGTSWKTKGWLIAGLSVLVVSAVMTSYGSYLASSETTSLTAMASRNLDSQPGGVENELSDKLNHGYRQRGISPIQ